MDPALWTAGVTFLLILTLFSLRPLLARYAARHHGPGRRAAVAEDAITKIRRTDGDPHDRLTRLAAVAIAAAEADPEWREGDRIFAAADDGHHSGVGAHNYASLLELAQDLERHAEVVSRARH